MYVEKKYVGKVYGLRLDVWQGLLSNNLVHILMLLQLVSVVNLKAQRSSFEDSLLIYDPNLT